MKLIRTVILCLAPTLLWAADFQEDFSSYTIGDDIGGSPDWDHDDEGGSFYVADFGGDNVLALDNSYDSGLYSGYSCDAAGIWLDGTVSMDYRFSGSNCYFALSARAYDDTAYIAGIKVVAAPLAVAFTACINGSGEYETYSEDFLINLYEDTWYNLTFEVTGTDPVNLTLYLNGDSVSDAVDETDLLPEGWAGFGAVYETEIDYLMADNFEIDDVDTAVTQTTFGQIKAEFLQP